MCIRDSGRGGVEGRSPGRSPCRFAPGAGSSLAALPAARYPRGRRAQLAAAGLSKKKPFLKDGRTALISEPTGDNSGQPASIAPSARATPAAISPVISGSRDNPTRYPPPAQKFNFFMAPFFPLILFGSFSPQHPASLPANPGMGWTVIELAVYQPVQLGEFIFLCFDQ